MARPLTPSSTGKYADRLSRGLALAGVTTPELAASLGFVGSVPTPVLTLLTLSSGEPVPA